MEFFPTMNQPLPISRACGTIPRSPAKKLKRVRLVKEKRNSKRERERERESERNRERESEREREREKE